MDLSAFKLLLDFVVVVLNTITFGLIVLHSADKDLMYNDAKRMLIITLIVDLLALLIYSLIF